MSHRLSRATLLSTLLGLASACAGSAPSGDDTDVSDRVFDNGACLVHADCGPGFACTLGRCLAACDEDNPCSEGLVCTDRGICAESGDEPLPTIPVLPAGGGVTLTASKTGITDGTSTTTIQNDTDRDVRVRLETEHPAVTVPTGVLTVPAGGSLDVTVDVDPAAFVEGQRTAVVRIVTSEARVDWLIVKPADPTGHWTGVISMPDDTPLGELALGVNLDFTDDGTVTGQTFSDESLFWPRDAAITGTWNPDSGDVEIWIRDVLPEDAEGLADGPANPLARDVGREIRLTGTLVPDGDRIEGTAEESLTGVADSPIVLSATFALSRDGDLREPSPTVTDFSDQVPMLAPAEEYPAQVDMDACAGLAVDYGTAGSIVGSDAVIVDACTACASQPFACTAEQARTCANGLLEAGFNLPTETKNGDNLQPPAMATWDVCTGDAPPVYDAMTKTTCLDRAAIDCAGALLRHAVAESGAAPDIVADALDQVLIEGRAAATIATERLIDAFFAYRDTSGTTKWMIEQGFIDDARAALADTLVVLYAPGFSHLLSAAGPDAITNTRFGIDVAQMLDLQSRAVEALAADLRLTQRVNPADADTSRKEIGYTGAWLHVQGAHVANLVDFYGIPDTYAQVPIVSEALGSLRNLAKSVGTDKNPFGFSPEFVPITLATEGPDGELLTNYEVVRDNANLAIDFYKTKLDAAEAVLETLAQAEYDIVSQTNDIVSSYDERLARLCGQLPGGEPNIESCGQETGEVRELVIRLEIAAQRVETAQLALANNEERIRIEESRIADVINNSKLLETTIDAKQQAIFNVEDEFGKKISAKEVAKLQNEKAKVWADAAFDAATAAVEAAAEAANADKPWGAAAYGIAGAAKVGIILGKAGAETAFMQKQFDLEQEIGDLESQMKREITIINQEIDAAIRNSELQEKIIDSEAVVRNLTLDSLLLAREVEQARLELQLAGAQIDTALTEVAALRAGKQRALDILATDPMNPFTNARFLRLRMELGQSLLRWRDLALAAAYKAGRALEFEINRDVTFIESKLYTARGADEIDEFLFCLDSAFQDYQANFSDIGSQALTMELSLRDDVFGLSDAVRDYLTDEDVSPEVQFANLLASPGVVNEDGAVELRFSLPLTGETLFPAAQCDARIESIEVQLVGENLGDNEAGVLIHRDGVSSLRRCDSANLSPEAALVAYHLQPESIGVQATVNGWTEDDTGKSFGYAGWPVSGSQWSVEIPTAEQDPRNADFDVRNVGDIVLRITYRAGTVSPNGDGFSPTCG